MKTSASISDVLLPVKVLILSPAEFFDQISEEGGWLEPFIFFSFCAAINALMLTVMAFAIANMALTDPEIIDSVSKVLSPPVFVACFLVNYAAMTIGSFFISGATTLALHFFGGKGSFLHTYRVLACCWVTLLVSWIPLIGMVLALYFFVIAWHGLTKAHAIAGWKCILSIFLGTLGLMMVAFLSSVIAIVLWATFNHSVNTPSSVFERAPQDLLDRYREP